MKRLQRQVADLKDIFEAAARKSANGYVIQNDLLYKEIDDDLRLVVLKAMQSQIIRNAYENDHFSVDKTEKIIKRDYWCAGMRPKIAKILHNCISCF